MLSLITHHQPLKTKPHLNNSIEIGLIIQRVSITTILVVVIITAITGTLIVYTTIIMTLISTSYKVSNHGFHAHPLGLLQIKVCWTFLQLGVPIVAEINIVRPTTYIGTYALPNFLYLLVDIWPNPPLQLT